MSLSLALAARLATHAAQASALLAGPTDPGAGGINLNAPAQPIPGMGNTLNNWIGWAKTLAIAAGMIGLLVCAIMMMIGRRNRSHLAAEGASGLLWVLAGLSVASMAGGIVATALGG